MKNVYIQDNFKDYFAALGLNSFDDFFNAPGGKRINKNNKRDVQVFNFDLDGQTRTFYLKRFFKPHIKDMFAGIQNFHRLLSQAEIEYQNANLLLDSNIETYHPACWGEHLILGIERHSFLITEELPFQCLTEFITEKWQDLESDEKERILTSVGKLTRKIHDCCISLPDLYLWHFFIRENEFAVIDLTRMKHGVTNRKELLENLGRLHHSMKDKYFDESSRRLLIEAYAGGISDAEFVKLLKKVKKYSAKISRRRNPKPY